MKRIVAALFAFALLADAPKPPPQPIHIKIKVVNDNTRPIGVISLDNPRNRMEVGPKSFSVFGDGTLEPIGVYPIEVYHGGSKTIVRLALARCGAAGAMILEAEMRVDSTSAVQINHGSCHF